MTYQLRTRPPTGRVPWPLILIEGPEKSGKSWACAELSASSRVGRTYWIDLGEGSADEYGAITGTRYEVVEHDGTIGQILAAVTAIKAEAERAQTAGAPPVVLVIDSMTAEWELLKGVADAKARARLAKKGRSAPADAEPQISMDLWNGVNGLHRRLMTLLMTMPGIVVMTARGKHVAALDAAGRPVEGSREYKVEGQKGLAYDAICGRGPGSRSAVSRHREARRSSRTSAVARAAERPPEACWMRLWREEVKVSPWPS